MHATDGKGVDESGETEPNSEVVEHKRKTVTKVEKEATTLLHCFVLHLTHINRGALQESLLNLSS